MNLREIVEVVGLPLVDLSHQAGISRFRLYEFMKGRYGLTDSEQRAVLDTLLRHGQKVEEALNTLRRVAIA